MEHVTDHDLERFYLGMVPDGSPEEQAIEEHLLWCRECVARAEASDGYVDAIRAATIRGNFDLGVSPIPFSPDFSSYFAPEVAVRSKRQITKGIGNEEAVEWKTVCVAPDQSVCSACFAKRANAARDKRSILARTALSLRFCLVAAW